MGRVFDVWRPIITLIYMITMFGLIINPSGLDSISVYYSYLLETQCLTSQRLFMTRSIKFGVANLNVDIFRPTYLWEKLFSTRCAATRLLLHK